MDFKKISLKGVEWTYLAQDRRRRHVLVNIVMTIRLR
jgi:hypothetical protein